VSKSRHWKQRWIAGAPMAWRRRVRIGEEPTPFVEAGSIVTAEQRGRFGRRLKTWWDAGLLEWAPGWAPGQPAPRAKGKVKKELAAPAAITA